MQRRLEEPPPRRRLYPWRNAGTVGLAMAACVAIGFTLPSVLTSSSDDSVATDGSARPVRPFEGTVVNAFERSTMLENFDAGSVMIGGRTPAQKIRQQRVDSYIWTDPTTNLKYEFSIPSEQDVLAPAVRQ